MLYVLCVANCLLTTRKDEINKGLVRTSILNKIWNIKPAFHIKSEMHKRMGITSRVSIPSINTCRNDSNGLADKNIGLLRMFREEHLAHVFKRAKKYKYKKKPQGALRDCRQK